VADVLHEVLGCIDGDEVVDFVKELVKRNTVASEKSIVPVITDSMKDMGMDVEVLKTHDPKTPDIKRPCILGTLRGESEHPLLCYNGHADVVPVEFPEKWSHDPFDPVVDQGKLYGRGASDMKGGLGAMIMAARAIAEAGVVLKGTLVIAAVPGEETGGWGTEFIADKMPWDAVVIGEPTELSVNPACNGITTFSIRVTGKSAHASMPERGINAVDKMLKVMNAFENYKRRLSSRVHSLTGTPAFVSCVIRGGWRNVIVADECRLNITTHLIPGETTASRFEEIVEILDALQDKDPELSVEMLDWNDNPVKLPLPDRGPLRPKLDPTEISVDEPVVKAMLGGAEKVLGERLPVGGSRYACDSPFFVNERNVPTLIFGPGSIDQAHTYDEWIDVEQLLQATKVYAAGALVFLNP
jgi:acetylornithine deacetylase/succinyl-diaminopimelate desuccinylase family protein